MGGIKINIFYTEKKKLAIVCAGSPRAKYIWLGADNPTECGIFIPTLGPTSALPTLF